MNTPNPQFDKWFYESEGYSFRSERFFSDLDYFGTVYNNREISPENYHSSQIIIKKWLEAAFEVGKRCR